MLNNQREFSKALQELKIRVKNDEADREELNKILMEILGYPNIEQAQKHHRANNIGTNDLIANQKKIEREIMAKKIQKIEVCGCCGMMVNNQELPYCTNFSDINMAVGVRLFFRNYLWNALIFLLMFLIYSIYALASNLSAFNQSQENNKNVLCIIKGTEDEGCGFSVIGAGSKILQPNKDKNVMSVIQAWIGLGFVIIWGLILILKSHTEKKMVVEMETERVSASDFTLMLTHFPRIYLEKTYEENLESIRQMFKAYGKKVDSIFSYNVVKFNIGRPLYLESKSNQNKKEKAIEELRDRQDIFRRWIKYRMKNLEFPIKYADREREYDKYYEYFSKKYDQHINYEVPLQERNVIFVTMLSSKAREEIENRNQPPSWKNFWNFCSKAHDFPLRGVTIRKAPEPEEIKWNNIGFPVCSKYLRKAGLWLITIILISISLGISIGISRINKNKISESVSIGISIIITIFNVGIQLAIMILSTLENQYISSVEQSNIAFKIGLGQLLNSILVPIIVTVIANNDDTVEDKTWLKAGGLVDDVFYIALLNLIVPFGRLIDPWEIFLKLRRWFYSDPSSRLKMYGQKQLNALYGNYEFDIGYEYSYLIKTSIFTAFFVTMQPIIAVFAPIGLLIYYLIDKRNYLRHFQRPSYHYPSINNVVDFILMFSMVAFGFGALLVNSFIIEEIGDERNGTLAANWITVGVAFFFVIFIPLRVFYCCMKKPQLPQWDYLDKKALLNSDYDRLNPVTKAQAIADFEDFLRVLEEKQEIPDRSQFMKLTMTMMKKNSQQNMNKMMASRRNFGSQESLPRYNMDLNQYRNIIQEKNHGEGRGSEDGLN